MPGTYEPIRASDLTKVGVDVGYLLHDDGSIAVAYQRIDEATYREFSGRDATGVPVHRARGDGEPEVHDLPPDMPLWRLVPPSVELRAR